METIVLAGGFGTRLRGVVSDRPKPLALVSGRPFLEWQFEELARNGVERVVLAVGYLGQMIVDHFGSSFAGLDLSYAFEDKPLGTGGAIRNALSICRAAEVFVLNGDSFSSFPFVKMLAQFNAELSCVMAVVPVKDATRYGTVLWSNSDALGLVTAFESKGKSGAAWINSGTYLIRRQEFLSQTPSEPFSMETHYLELLCPSGRLGAVSSTSTFIDIGVPEDFELAQTYLPKLAKRVKVPPGL